MKYCIWICAILGLAGCSGTKVFSDMDESEDFSQFKTYEFAGWAEDSDKYLTRLDRERIENTFEEEANRRGLQEVEKDGDVIASLFLITQARSQQRANTTTTGMSSGMGRRGMRSPGWGWGAAHSTTTVSTEHFVEGTLVVEVFDKDDRELIWRALGTERINENPKKRSKDIKRIIAYIMNEYPVKPAK